MRIKQSGVALLLICVMLLAACGVGGSPVTTPIVPIQTTTPPTTTSDTPDTTPPVTTTSNTPDTTPPVTTPPIQPTGFYNPYTGLPVETEMTARPICITLNNIRLAAPQDGLSYADIVFEVEAEGGITRLLAVYSNPAVANVIGSIRSARPALVNIAMGLDGLYVHSGGSPQAMTDIRYYGVVNLDGHYDSTTFYQDPIRRATMGYEHSLVTTGARLASKISALARNGTRMTLNGTHKSPFAFYKEDTKVDGSIAEKVTTKYGGYQPYFRYSAETGLYQRYQHGARHMDPDTQTYLDFKNVVVLSVTSSVIDSAGRRDFNDVGSGDGYFATNGYAVPIQWSKASATAPLVLTYANGSLVHLNPGKTFISYVNGIANAVIGN